MISCHPVSRSAKVFPERPTIAADPLAGFGGGCVRVEIARHIVRLNQEPYTARNRKDLKGRSFRCRSFLDRILNFSELTQAFNHFKETLPFTAFLPEFS
jgi:hypothetical protein